MDDDDDDDDDDDMFFGIIGYPFTGNITNGTVTERKRTKSFQEIYSPCPSLFYFPKNYDFIIFFQYINGK